MKIESVFIGPLKISVNDFIQWASLRLEKLGLEITNNDGDETKVLSIEANIKYMKEGDARIEKLGRKFLYTHAPTHKQIVELTAFIKKNNLDIKFNPSVDSWIKADKTEAEMIGE